MRIVRSPVKVLVICVSLILFVVVSTVAQPGNPAGDPDVPITGIEILLALGGFLGVKKFLSKKKTN